MNILKKINKFVTPFRKFGELNFEAKIGVVLLIPPLSSVLIFFAMSDMDECFYYDYGSDSIVASNTPLYLGLMAIAGAYLIKGNINK